MKNSVPAVDLSAQHQALQPEIEAAMARVLSRNEFVLGHEVAEFEKEFAAYCGVKYAIAVNSGTSALHLALLATGIKPGDEVITVPFTFVATLSAILYVGAKPVFVDIDPATFNLDVTRLERAITPRTRAIIPVHLYGHPADMKPLLSLARQYQLKVVEDAAQAHGAEYHGPRVGGLGDVGCFSFYPTKNLGACGEGGMVTTQDETIAADVRSRRDWGAPQKYHYDRLGFNYRMEGLQGAILRVKLPHLETWTEKRRAVAQHYDRGLEGLALQRPMVADGVRHVYHLYTVRVKDRDEVREKLQGEGISTILAYPCPLHRQLAFRDLGYAEGDFPEAERAAREVCSLPLYPEITETQVEAVITALRQVVPRSAGS
jgi:dTDP-4-amino-4,6-dideoxygalactose transaminase